MSGLDKSSRLAVLDGLPADTLLIHEVYASIQGESSFAGWPCVFVRLTGCPLRCHWCDTPHAFQEGRPRTLGEIEADVLSLSPQLVEITGGEPLAQPAVLPLMTRLADLGRRVLIETSGAYSLQGIDPRIVVIMDLKCPDSGEEQSNHYPNIDLLKSNDELKFVIASRRDFEWAVATVREFNLSRFTIHCSPAFGLVSYRELSEWILGSGLPLRFQAQLHKHIWDPKTRGV